MVIKRTYRVEAPQRRPDRRLLGKVQVTIDDLRVLMEILQKGRSDIKIDPTTGAITSGGTPDVKVEFDVGEFSDAADMRELSDAELADLRVRAGKTIVHLSPSRAESIGPVEVNDLVENAWARPRQTRKRPGRTSPWWKGSRASAAFVFVTCAASLAIGWVSTGRGLGPNAPVLAGIALFLLLLAGGLLGNFEWRLRAEGNSSYAVVLPLSIDELRKQKRGKSKWPIVSATIAAVALVVSLTFNLINLLNSP